jgi:putative transcriptional regulator
MDVIARGGGPRQAVFALGYAGWGAGQLEGEIARNDWLVGDGRSDLLFGRADEFKWAAALKSIGVDPVALSATGGRA